MAPVTGKWNIFGVNIPDFGKTEKFTTWQANPLAVQSYGAPQSVPATTSGMQSIPSGTQYSLGPNVSRTATSPTVASTGQVLGDKTVGGGVSSTGSTGGGNTDGGEDPNQSLWNEIDSIYNQSMGYANQAESTLRSNQPTVEADIQGQYQSAVKGAETQKAIGERELQGSATEAGARQEDALTAGRRLYNELMMGGQQRFGGASSAGQAYGELTAREFQRGQAGTRNAFQNAMTKITELKSNLQDKFSTAMYNLEQQKMSAINEAKRAFDEKILEINRMRAEAGQNKSSMRLEMLQNLRNQIYQINLASAQSNTQLAQQKAQQEQILSQLETQASSAATGGQQAVSNLQAQTTTNPTTQLAINTPQQVAPQTYTGRRKDEQLTGYALPKREDLYV